MRHAKAMERDEHLFGDDSKRPLSKAGIKEHKRVSKMLYAMGVGFDHILTSPFDRAMETARITRKVYDFEERPIECNELADEFSVDNLVKRLSSYKTEDTILLVGHEPHMSTFASAMLWPGHPMGIDFKKSGVMCIRFDDFPEKGQGVLEFFIKPKLLKALRKSGKGKGNGGPKMKKDSITEGAIMKEQDKGDKKYGKKASGANKDRKDSED